MLYSAAVPGLLAIDYRWWVFIHLTGVFGFLLAHGVSTTVLFRLRRERDRERIRSLLQFSGSTVRMFYGSLALLLLGGIEAGLKVGYFHQKWIWISIGVLAGVTVLMLLLARPYYKKIAAATELRPSGVPRISDEELASRLESPTPIAIAAIGGFGLLVILYLMIFKPA
jgi:hypothetical protein